MEVQLIKLANIDDAACYMRLASSTSGRGDAYLRDNNPARGHRPPHLLVGPAKKDAVRRVVAE